MAASPFTKRRQLAAALREIRARDSRGLGVEAVAAELCWSPSKLSRYERAKTGLQPREVERLLDYYQINGARRGELMGLAREAEGRPWWSAFEEDLFPGQDELVGLEQGAATILAWQKDVIPELLQTEEYAKHTLASYAQVEPMWPGRSARLAALRVQRQRIIAQDSPAAFSAVIDEAVLLRPAGNGAMPGQLQHLVSAAGRDGIRIQVMPLSSSGRVPGGSFTVFQFADGQPDAVAVDGLRGVFFQEEEQDTYLHSIAFQAMAEAALGPEASRDLLLSMAATWPAEPSRLLAPA